MGANSSSSSSSRASLVVCIAAALCSCTAAATAAAAAAAAAAGTAEEAVARLLQSGSYNRNQRPAPLNAAGQQQLHVPTDVSVNLHVVSFSTMSVQNMDFTVNIYLRMIWQDWRLAAAGGNSTLSLHTLKDLLWLPDIFFRNAKQVEGHSDPVPNILVKLQPKGIVYFSQKLTVRLWCVMDLRDFPMDCQTCRIEIGAYGSTLDEVRFHWYSSSVTLEEDAMQVPEFSSPSIEAENCTKAFSVTGEFACLRANVRLHRTYGFYIMNTYIPFALMVCISWINFWIDVRSTPARVTIAFLTVLAVVTQNAGTQMTGMPRVSYFKAIDLFMMASLMFVIVALIEFAVANFLTRQQEKLHAGASCTTNSSRRCARTEGADARGSEKRAAADGSGEPLRMEEPRRQKQRTRYACCCYGSRRVNRLDYWSRFLFPLAYAVFNALYWAHYLRDRDHCS